jgi:hypothetical protein
MLLRLPQRDGVDVIATLGIGQMHQVTVQKAQHIDSLLALDFPILFPRHHRMIEHRITPHKVEPVLAEVFLALCFIPGHHNQIVYAI